MRCSSTRSASARSMSRPPASGPDAPAASLSSIERQRRPPRQRAQAVSVEIGQDRVEPASNVAAMKQMLGAQRPHQRVLHQIVGGFGVARQRPRIAPQRRNRRLDILVKRAHPISSNRIAAVTALMPKVLDNLASETPAVCHIFRVENDWAAPVGQWRALTLLQAALMGRA